MQPDAPILLERLRTDELGKTGDKPTNVAAHIQHKRGDLEAGFAAADVIVEREFRTETVHQGYIEPHNGTAIWNDDGHIQVWSQHPGRLRRAQPGRRHPAGAGLPGHGHAAGDRRRLRRQDQRLPGAAGRAALAQVRPSPGQDEHDPRRGADGHRPHVRLLDHASRSAPRRTARSRQPRPSWSTRPAPSPARRSAPAPA